MVRTAVLLLTFASATWASAVQSTKDNPAQVTCGSTIKLQHSATNRLLHSHEVSYGTGSGQQSVTGFESGNDANSYWVVKGPKSVPCLQGTPLKTGSTIRFQHVNTRRWLHSHHFPSPLSNQQEVSCFGNDNESDHLDEWLVETEKGATLWFRDAWVKLRHKETGVYLATHNKVYQRPIAGQTEICGKKTSADLWAATEGVYFPPRTDL
eukprot:jgi/Botrbrau1/6113/Bobra.331_2s0008.1